MAQTNPSRPDLIKALEHITAEVDNLRALLARDGAPTLREVLASIEQQTGEAAAAAYPQGIKYLVDGHPRAGPLPEAIGFGGRPYNELRLAAVAAHAKRVRNLVAYRKTHSGRELAQPDPNAHGNGAEEQVVRAARWVAKVLVAEGWLPSNPLLDLKTPKRVGNTRDNAFTDDELRDYCSAVLRGCDDKLLTALVWTTLRVSAIRNDEVVGLRIGGVQLGPSYFTVLGKGSHHRQVPMHRPVLATAVRRALRMRGDRGPGASLWPARGGSFSGGFFDAWTTYLKKEHSWARGHEIGPHMLRHTAARRVKERYGHSDVTALYLGDSLKSTLGTVAEYLHSPYVDDVAIRRTVVEEVFGPLDGWPRLPESPILQPIWDTLGTE